MLPIPLEAPKPSTGTAPVLSHVLQGAADKPAVFSAI